jgi:hypothetical protein
MQSNGHISGDWAVVLLNMALFFPEFGHEYWNFDKVGS